MKRIEARHLLNYTTEQLWQILTGEFVLVFADGEIQTNARESLYSSYAWNFHRRFPRTPLSVEHHVNSILKGKRLTADTHLELLGVCMWATYGTYTALPTVEDPAAIDIDPLSEMVYQLVNEIYNDLSYRCEEYVVSLDIVDFNEVLSHPKIEEVNDKFLALTLDPSSTYDSLTKGIEHNYETIRNALHRDPALAQNPISLGVRSKFAKLDSVLQCVGPRGFLTDTDSYVFKEVPVARGYASGLRLFVDSFVESRSAAKSLIFSKEPLQQAEYFSRRLQLMSQIVQRLHPGDCRSQEYLLWKVRDIEYRDDGRVGRPADLKQLVGKYYLDDDGKGKPVPGPLKTLRADDKHLLGKYVHLRSVVNCAHPDPYGICATCFGELSLSVPAGTNIGHMCCTSMTQKSSQSVLSVKHMDSSSAVEGIVLGGEERRFLRAGADENSYLFAESLKKAKVELVIPATKAEKLTDVMEVGDVRELTVTRISELDYIVIKADDGRFIEEAALNVSIGRRLASLTHEMLAYVKQKGWSLNEAGAYVIDMSAWDWSQPILVLPLKHFNMSDHSKEIAELLESSVEELESRANMPPEDILVDFFDLVNSKLTVNLAVLEVTLYGAMIRSAEEGDFALPKPWTSRGLGVMSMSMANRSLSVAMAYENHRENLASPLSYTHTNRPDHPMDMVLMPAEVGKYLPS